MWFLMHRLGNAPILKTEAMNDTLKLRQEVREFED